MERVRAAEIAGAAANLRPNKSRWPWSFLKGIYVFDAEDGRLTGKFDAKPVKFLFRNGGYTATAPRKERKRVGIRLRQGSLRSQSVLLAGIVLLAFLVRMVIVVCVFRNVAAPTFDHNEFGWEMGWTARSIAEGRGFSSPFFPITGPTALVPPLYPYLLAFIFKVCGLYTAKSAFVALSLNSVLSSLTVLPVYFSAKQALNRRIATFATLGWALYPYSIYFSADRVWDYALTALLFSLCFWSAQKLHLRSFWAWAGVGLLCGVTTLSNPSVLPVLAVLLAIALIKVRNVDGAWVSKGAIAALAFIALCSPWAVRNHRVLHQDSFIRDGFWLEFWAGNNGDTFESNARWTHPASNPVEMQEYKTAGEGAYMAQKRVLALNFVQHHPVLFVQLCFRRVFRFWTGYWSFSREYLALEPLDVPNVAFCSVLTLLLIRGARRWWMEDRGGAFPYLVAVVLFPVAYYMTHSSMDYRQPIEPILVVLVLVGVLGTGDWPEHSYASADDDLQEVESDEALLAMRSRLPVTRIRAAVKTAASVLGVLRQPSAPARVHQVSLLRPERIPDSDAIS